MDFRKPICDGMEAGAGSLLCRVEVEDWAIVGNDFFKLLHCTWIGSCWAGPGGLAGRCLASAGYLL